MLPLVLYGGENVGEKRAVLSAALQQAGFEIATVAEMGSENTIGVFIHTHKGSAELADDGHSARLVNVLFHKVIPTGLCANAPCIDLVQWRGGQDNAHFLKLVAILRQMQQEWAEQAQKQNSPPGWVIALWQRHRVGALIFGALSFVILAFIQNIVNAETACSINFAQPTISDACGYLGLGDKPNKTERLAWEEIDLTNCDALQAHAREFKDGAYRATAIDLYNAASEVVQTRWEPQTRETILFEPGPQEGSDTEELARTALTSIVIQKAQDRCMGYTAGNSHRVISASFKPNQQSCSQIGTRHYCEYDGYAICQLERRVEETIRVCGKQ